MNLDLCARCGQPLLPTCVSLYFCDIWCQSKWYMERLKKERDRALTEPADAESRAA